jgi:ATP-dependent exoDNAse (exonuclease V) beta subunit
MRYPFSLQARRDNKPVILRGVIDCVVEREDGSVVIVEFKTGRPRSWHARQLDLYVEAATAVFPEARVDGRLIYAD